MEKTCFAYKVLCTRHIVKVYIEEFSPGAQLLFSHEVKIRLLIFGHEQISIFTNITKHISQ